MLWPRHRVSESTLWAPLFAGGDPHKIPIDSNGNLTSKTEGSDSWTYSWNAENQLTKVEKNGAEQARFAYDPLGRRAEKVAGGQTTSYTYDNEDILREVRGGTPLKLIHGPDVDEPLAVDEAAALSYFHVDALGSVVRVTNVSGAVTLTRQYDAWGNLEVGATEPGYAFTSREWDPEIELHYYRARFFDARLGRFIGEDPIDLLEGINLYAYVGSNPANFIDPSGEICVPSWMREAFITLYMMTGRRRPPTADMMEKMKQQTRIEIQIKKPKPGGPPGGGGGRGPSSSVIIMITPCLIAPQMWWINPATDRCEPRPNACCGT